MNYLQSMAGEVFFGIFFMFWFGICYLLSKFGGWGSLAKNYSNSSSFIGKRLFMQSMSINSAGYNGVLTFGVNELSLFISILLPFRFGHPSILIPLNNISGAEYKGWVYQYVDLSIKDMPFKIRILKKLALKIESYSNGNWQFKRI